MRRTVCLLCLVILLSFFAGCGGSAGSGDSSSAGRPADGTASEGEETGDSSMEERTIIIRVGGTAMTADLEDNDAAKAWLSMLPMTVTMSGYGGFEQVGPLGTELPQQDARIRTSPGDIMLYNGDQVVIFYGSNSWEYTRLGKIRDLGAEELEEILGDGTIEVTFEKK